MQTGMNRVTADVQRDHDCYQSSDLLMYSCRRSSQMVCRATFNSSVVLGFGWALFYFARCNSLAGTNLETGVSMNPREFAEKLGVFFVETAYFVIFRYEYINKTLQ